MFTQQTVNLNAPRSTPSKTYAESLATHISLTIDKSDRTRAPAEREQRQLSNIHANETTHRSSSLSVRESTFVASNSLTRRT
jgi:hypothetical protein